MKHMNCNKSMGALLLILFCILSILLTSCVTGVSFSRKLPAEIDLGGHHRVGIYQFQADPNAPYAELITRVATDELKKELKQVDGIYVRDLSSAELDNWWENQYWDYPYNQHGGWGYDGDLDTIVYGRITNIRSDREVLLEGGVDISYRYPIDLRAKSYHTQAVQAGLSYFFIEHIEFSFEYVMLDRVSRKLISHRRFPRVEKRMRYLLPSDDIVYFSHYTRMKSLISEAIAEALEGEHERFSPQMTTVFRPLMENDDIAGLADYNDLAESGQLRAALDGYLRLWKKGHAEAGYNAAICFEAMNNLSAAWAQIHAVHAVSPSVETERLITKLREAIMQDEELRRQLNSARF